VPDERGIAQRAGAGGLIMRTIVHLSDMHFGRLDERILPPLIAAIRALAPHLVVVSGDLSQRARRGQFIRARRFLDELGLPRLVIPGNHDIPLYNVAARMFAPFANFTRYMTSDLDPVFADDEMIVGLNSARSVVLQGRGRLNEVQVERAAARLMAAPPNAIKIVVTHHPFDLPKTHGPGHLVGRSQMAMAKFAAAGAHVFLAGHLHLSHIGSTASRYQIAGHNALVVQAGTLSTRLRGEVPAFNALRIASSEIAVEQHLWNDARATFEASAARKWRLNADRTQNTLVEQQL
jgi:3',5'-cyclic AMP phosphodiesterase CpdA